MFGRTVKIESKEYFVFCSPNTPHSVILRRAAYQAECEEKQLMEERMKSSPYYHALRRS